LKATKGTLSYAKVNATRKDTRDYSPDWLSRRDEILLIDAGFESGILDTTFWRKGNDGRMYCAAMEDKAENLRWYYTRENGGLNNYTDSINNWMKREDFISLFR
jgi:hypothetical protein